MILLSIFVYYMNPETRKVELLWHDKLPQESIESCKKAGDRMKWVAETKNIEVQYFCHVQ